MSTQKLCKNAAASLHSVAKIVFKLPSHYSDSFPQKFSEKSAIRPSHTSTAPPTISEGQLCPVNVSIGLRDSRLPTVN